MVPAIQNLVAPSKYSIKCPYTMTPEGVTVHNSGNDAPAKNEVKYMITNGKKVSFHYAVDNIEIVQGLPLNRNSFNAGDGANGKGNRKTISYEICYSKNGGERFLQAERNAAEHIAGTLKEHNWSIDRVYTHNKWNGKDCPKRTLQLGWDRYLGMIDSYMGNIKSIKAREVNPYLTPITTLRYSKTLQYVARTDAMWLQWELNQAGYDLKVDGKYGTATLTALKGYQAANKLAVDGECGPKTRASLQRN